mgnify:CR=1 FL=1
MIHIALIDLNTLTQLFSLDLILVISAGVIFGILAGAIPGISSSVAVALMIPFTYGLEPAAAILLLISVYLSSSYGGSISAIMINTPGTPGSIATTFDGYPLSQKGKPGLALGIALISSTIGGIIGMVLLILFSVPIAKFALTFGPPEFFLLAILGLSIVSSISSENKIKGFLATFLGLALATVGSDPFTGYYRFTMKNADLSDGFSLISVLIGLFAIGEILIQIENYKFETLKNIDFSNKFPNIKILSKIWKSILRSSIIGTIIGAIPGAGGTVATFIAYDQEKKFSKIKDTFGKGNINGIAAPEAANSSAVGGALIPLLTLGIPGSASTAILLGAFYIHGIVPGPQIFETQTTLIHKIFLGVIIANFVMFLFGRFGNKYFIKVVNIPKPILFAIIPSIALIGSYSLNNSLFDVLMCIFFGIVGWAFKKVDIPLSSLILGFVLGDLVESNFRRTLLMGDLNLIYQRTTSLIIIFLMFSPLFYNVLKKLIRIFNNKKIT